MERGVKRGEEGGENRGEVGGENRGDTYVIEIEQTWECRILEIYT